jgi:hypothetical protein
LLLKKISKTTTLKGFAVETARYLPSYEISTAWIVYGVVKLFEKAYPFKCRYFIIEIE